jgi:two-component system chemotaxis sensor kinase CheA
MVTDLDQFKATYIQEANELLEDMEERLLNLNQEHVDIEEINAIFRCAHSIKGGGGAFGFSRLVGFTHILEYLLDALRTQQMEINPDIVDALLKSVDVVKTLVSAAKNGVEAEAGFEDELLATLKATVESGGKTVETVAPVIASAPAKKSTGEKTFTINFKPHHQLFASGNEPIYIIRELQKFAKLQTEIDISAVPDLYDLDVEDCYLKWNIYATTSGDIKNIKEAFEFVEDECKLSIEEGSAPATIAVDDPDGAFGLFDDVPAPAAKQNSLEDPNGAFGLFDDAITEIKHAKESGIAPASNISPEPAPAAKPAAAAAAPAKDDAVTSIRVDISKVDKMVNMVGELVITQAMIMQRMQDIPQQYLGGVMQGISELSRHTRDLQEAVMAVRMQPVKSVFAKLPRIVRDVSRKLNKEVRLETKGEATEIDKTVIEKLSDPLTHMIRNSLDHGIEKPEDRVAKGKPREGVIILSADGTGGRIIIEISDDGNGINRERVLKKAKEKGLVPQDANPPAEEIDNMIFLPGFSTAEKVTDVSGRGVGMDVVSRNIKELGGEIQMQNIPGQGSRFTISLPLTLAILDGMIIRVGTEKYIIPISNIIETMCLKASDVQRVKNDSEVINVRGEFLPIVHLNKIFKVPGAISNPNKVLVVLVEVARQKLGIVVDDLLGQQQVVIKNLEENADHVDGVSGATILGDGNVSLILDVAQILKMGLDSKFLKEVA